MSGNVGLRLAGLAEDRTQSEEAPERTWLSREDLNRARAEANLAFFRGNLERRVASFNRSSDPALGVELRADDQRLEVVQSYSLLMALVFGPETVELQSPPQSGRVSSRRFRLLTTESGRMELLEEDRDGAQPGELERFLEVAFLLALRMYP